METTAQILIYIHAATGGLALLSGAIALMTKKGSRKHKKSGLVFFYSMLTSALLALIISILPGHLSPFLFCIGLFSSYFILSGYSSLRFKKKDFNLNFDRFLAVLLTVTGMVMIVYAFMLEGEENIVLIVFGIFGVFFGIRDFQSFRDLSALRKIWLQRHIGNMTGGYIAATTAFMVVNEILPGLLNWFLPTVLGSLYISYWIRKIRRKSTGKPIRKIKNHGSGFGQQ